MTHTLTDEEIHELCGNAQLHTIALLCIEAGVCLTGDTYQPVQIHAHTHNVDNGLLVTDKDGKTYRLRVVAVLQDHGEEV